MKTLASFYKNPLVENNSLTGIYERLIDTAEADAIHEDPELKTVTRIHEVKSRRAQIHQKTIETIVCFLTEKSIDSQLGALSLFYFFGCFEDGISENTIGALFPRSSLFADQLYLLKRMGIIDTGSTLRLSVNRLLHKFVLTTKFASCRISLMSALCSHYI